MGRSKAAEKLLTCPECGKVVSNRGALTLHRRYQHGVGVPPRTPGAQQPGKQPVEQPAEAAREQPTATDRGQPETQPGGQPDGRARMEERSVPLWQLELERERQRREKLEEQLRALGQSLEGLTQALPGVRQGVEAATKGQEQVLARIETLTQAVGTIGEDVKGVTALKAELKSLCDLYPDLCKVVEERKKAPEAPPAPPAPAAAPEPPQAGHPSGPAPGQVLGVEQAIELLKHWTGCPECVEKLRPRLQTEPGLLESLVKTYVPPPKEETRERGFVG